MSREALIAVKNFIENLRVPQDKLQAVLQINQGAKILETIDAALEESAASGTAVLVGGQVVAWFRDFDDSSAEWCRDNHFGQWLTWRAATPETIALTPEEQAKVDAEVGEFLKFFNGKDSE